MIWDYAEKVEDKVTKEISGMCFHCRRSIKCSKGSFSSLKNHLKTHGIFIEDEVTQDQPAKKKMKTMLDYVQKQSLKEIVSDLATDGITIRAITRNSYIRKSIQRDGFKLPENESDVMKLIIEDYCDKKAEMIKEIKTKLEQGAKFSITIDEYTTVRGRRYFGINVHESIEKKTFKTGIVRIYGSCPAESMAESVKNHLRTLGIVSDRDVVASTQDGAAVNKKYMRIMDIVGQFCINHAIHLAVCDTLYKKRDHLIDIGDLDSIDTSEEDSFDELDMEILDDQFDDNIDFHELLKSAREVVKFIKNSTVRNHIFQEKVKLHYGHGIELHLDVKHRWNSIPTMIEPILKTKIALFETFSELNALEMINNLDFNGLKTLLQAMAPIKLAVEVLSRQDSTLLTANSVIEFAYKKLTDLNSDISNELLINLKKRIDERWNRDVTNLLKSLRDPSNVPSKATIDFAGKLSSRLFGTETYNDAATLNEESNSPTDASKELSLYDELNILLNQDAQMTTIGSRDRKSVV
jgi:hypothetical protein